MVSREYTSQTNYHPRLMKLQTTVEMADSRIKWEGFHQANKPEDLPGTNQSFTAFG